MLITGPSGGGKEQFIAGLLEQPQDRFLVSLETAAALIQEERRNDQSDFTEGGVDPGRTAGQYIAEVLPGCAPTPAMDAEVRRWGIEPILGRGLKYLSTGEIKRTLLCRAVLGRARLLIIADPFAGLDTQSRRILSDFFESCSTRAPVIPRLVISLDRYAEVPSVVSRVMEFAGGAVTFEGPREDYEKLLQDRARQQQGAVEAARQSFKEEVAAITAAAALREGQSQERSPAAPVRISLVEFRGVSVGWGGKQVLENVNWQVYAGEHWLIRGPNGAGKTTMLELITGDNMQVFCNEVYLFGRRRGSGETLWDIRKNLGIVSHRLHLEYRMVGGTALEDVLVSGFHDSIGLYEAPTDQEVYAAQKWLALGGMQGRGREPFSALSYGEQRAALILRAAVKTAPLLILDEPCHSLDEQSRRMILDLLETLGEQGSSTLLHVTHDPTEELSCEKHIFEFRPRETPMYRVL
jgi:molybdate transport system ATP-binding protein